MNLSKLFVAQLPLVCLSLLINCTPTPKAGIVGGTPSTATSETTASKGSKSTKKVADESDADEGAEADDQPAKSSSKQASTGDDAMSSELLAQLKGSWRSECILDDSDPADIYYYRDYFDVTPAGAWEASGSDFTDSACTKPYAGSENYTEALGDGIKLLKEISTGLFSTEFSYTKSEGPDGLVADTSKAPTLVKISGNKLFIEEVSSASVTTLSPDASVFTKQ